MYAISSATMSSLAALMSMQDDMNSLQNRIATGKKVNDPSDNMSVFFKAQSYQTKADYLDDTNGNMDLAVQHLKLTNTSIQNMIDNLKSARQSVIDALSKPATVAGTAFANTAFDRNGNPSSSAKTYLSTAASTAAPATPTTPATPDQMALKGAIIDNAGTGKDNSSLFQVGDSFALTVSDPNGVTSVKYFKAIAAPTSADNGASTATFNSLASTTGAAPGSAYQFYDLASLATAIQNAFGSDTVNASVVAGADPKTPGFRLNLSLTSTTASASFTQVAGVAQEGPNSGASFDFGALIGGNPATSTTYLQSLKNSGVAANNLTTSTTYTFSPTPGSTNSAGVAARTQAQTMFNNTLYSVNNLLNSGGLPGFVNLFSGALMNVVANDDGSQTYAIQLNGGTAVTMAGLNFTAFNPATGATNFSGDGQFNSDNNLNTARTALDGALDKLNAFAATIAASTAGISSRLDFNKATVAALRAGVSAMTAADTASDSVALTNMQNASQLLVAALSKSNQTTQSLSRFF